MIIKYEFNTEVEGDMRKQKVFNDAENLLSAILEMDLTLQKTKHSEKQAWTREEIIREFNGILQERNLLTHLGY
jgi:hypothetical protein